MTTMNADQSEKESLISKVEFAVQMKSPCCASKVKDALKNIPGIASLEVDPRRQRLVVEGNVKATTVQHAVESKTGMSTVLLGQGSAKANLGAGVAAINIGSNSVKGLLRFIQLEPDMCVIEGTVDELPTSEPIYLSLHETGDISEGCKSCGPPLSQGGKFSGVVGKLHPSDTKRAEFRLTAANVNIFELYGHCAVIHRGDIKDVEQNKSERLACGIIARASGIFENSKRFCSCDGVSIWEQRSMDRQEERT